MAALFSYDPPALEASDDDSCLNCGHHELDHLSLEEAEFGYDVTREWDGRCLIEDCTCKNYQ